MRDRRPDGRLERDPAVAPRRSTPAWSEKKREVRASAAVGVLPTPAPLREGERCPLPSRIVRLADDGRKMTALTRAAMADLEASAEFRLYLLAKARKETTKEAMLSLRHRIDAMRTLAANVRYQTETRR